MADSGDSGRVQILVTPSSLVFYANDATSHKQMLSLYNPHDFSVNFKIYSTAPAKYSVLEPSGVIQTRKCVDLTVRHKEPTAMNEGKTDKFRVSFSAHVNGHVFNGKKDVPSTLLASSSPPGSSVRNLGRVQDSDSATSDWVVNQRRAAATVAASLAGDDLSPNGMDVYQVRSANSSIWLLATIGLVCILLLFMPTKSLCRNENVVPSQSSQGDQSFWANIWPYQGVPEALELSHNTQLVAAYILGLISLAILR